VADVTRSEDILSAISDQLASAVEKIGPSLVQVNGRERQPASGVAFAPGLVLTATHVLERTESITVETHDGRTLNAQLVGHDPSTDLAVLRVADLNLAAAEAADETAKIGQLVLAVGRPGSGGPMASAGIISTLGGPLRVGPGAVLERYICTDARPYPGFSGGAIITSSGQVLGIATSGLTQGVALAIPADIAWRVAEAISKHGTLKRGYLGISSQPVEIPANLREELKSDYGLLIAKVEEGSPAQKAGVLVGDILVSLDGRTVAEIGDLQVLLTGERVGKTLDVQVIRGGQLKSLKVTVGQRD
jgi:S1-C subfamily serine protease